MNKLTIFFIYALTINFLFPALFPTLNLLFFAPFIILSFYNTNKINVLWLALLCGLIVDLLSTHTRIGFYALNYCLTAWILYPQKVHFFEDSFSTLPIMTFLFSITSTFIQVFLFYILGQGILFSWELIQNDFIWLPIIDAIYAALAFTIPYLFYPKTSKRAPKYFTKKNFS
ncbi:MAG: rod shape-determining protein MreD [Parachlamydiaceae bacterium]|nr:rod shape-determining protein MreD [Parachlamydiaceae bacterium]